VKSVLILMGSQSDLPAVKSAIDVLREFAVPHEVRVASAHRSPDRVMSLVGGAETRGVGVVIAAAGGAAHLAGVAAAHTCLPVLGIPLATSPLSGIDSLLATAQMPSGVPVGTLGVGPSGASNAALLAVRILALDDEALRARVYAHRQRLARKVEDADAEVQAALRET
jgi:phosphoribosylaminoimidazole carboxylase PurE protein